MSSKRWLMSVALTACHVSGQGSSPNERISARCAELNQNVIAKTASGQLNNAKASLSIAAGGLVTSSEHTCEGLILSNMAAVMSITGRFAEAEQLAQRSIRIFAKDYPSNDLALLRPLHILAGAQLAQGNIGKARSTLNRMRSIQAERPEDRELVHAMAAAQLHAEGKLTEAEPEYLAALRTLEEAGKAVLRMQAPSSPVSDRSTFEERRLDEPRQALDRGLRIFVRA